MSGCRRDLRSRLPGDSLGISWSGIGPLAVIRRALLASLLLARALTHVALRSSFECPRAGSAGAVVSAGPSSAARRCELHRATFVSRGRGSRVTSGRPASARDRFDAGAALPMVARAFAPRLLVTQPPLDDGMICQTPVTPCAVGGARHRHRPPAPVRTGPSGLTDPRDPGDVRSPGEAGTRVGV